MLDAALIQDCADPWLQPAVVEQFVDAVGSPDPLAITVTAGDKMILASQRLDRALTHLLSLANALYEVQIVMTAGDSLDDEHADVVMRGRTNINVSTTKYANMLLPHICAVQNHPM